MELVAGIARRRPPRPSPCGDVVERPAQNQPQADAEDSRIREPMPVSDCLAVLNQYGGASAVSPPATTAQDYSQVAAFGTGRLLPAWRNRLETEVGDHLIAWEIQNVPPVRRSGRHPQRS
jgi:hypothetical protein